MNKNRVINATLWSFTGIFGRQGVVFIVGIFLARILEPQQFGLIAMIIVFSNFGQLFLDFGFSRALIQDIKTSQEDLSTIFYFNLGMSFAVGSVFFFASYAIASFFGEPVLIRLGKFLSLIFVFNAASIIQRTLLYKRLDLKSESFVIIGASLITGPIAIFLAYNGLGVWALAIKTVLQSFTECLLLWLVNDWRPSLTFEMSSIRKFSRFALNMFGAGFLNKLTENIDKLIIGKLFASAQLGFFERAKQFKDLAGQPLGGVFSKVMFPVFSNLQNDNERFLAGYRKTIRVVALLVIPVFFGLIVVAKPLIVFLITDKWLFSAKLLQILATSGFSYPLSAIMVIAIAAKGRADIFFKLDIAKTALCITSILIGSLWGIIGVAVAIAAAGYLGIYINIYAISKLMKLPVIEQFKDMGFPMIISAVMLLVLSAVANFGELTYINQLVILPIAGTMFYIGCTYFFDRSRFAEVRGMSMELGA